MLRCTQFDVPRTYAAACCFKYVRYSAGDRQPKAECVRSVFYGVSEFLKGKEGGSILEECGLIPC
ncbi:MAG: hypothetical protein QHH02_03055 [Syntrophomonadaceae bacterium]|nr:hypothetical protein [Syntrophomonadaceae bacterium]